MSQQGGQPYTTVEFPVWKYIKYILITLLAGFLIGVTAVLIAWKTDYYQQVGFGLLNTFLTHWWLTPSILVVLSVVILVTRKPAKNRR